MLKNFAPKLSNVNSNPHLQTADIQTHQNIYDKQKANNQHNQHNHIKNQHNLNNHNNELFHNKKSVEQQK